MSCNGRPGQPRARQITRAALAAMHPGALRSIWMPIEHMRVTISEHGNWRHHDGFEKKENRLLEWESCFGMCRHVICC